MKKNIFLIILVAGAAFAVWKFIPQIFTTTKKSLEETNFTHTGAVKAAVDVANKILPEDKQLKLPTTEANQSVAADGTNTEKITEIVKEKITETTNKVTQTVKDSTHNQFCKVITQQVQEECGAGE